MGVFVDGNIYFHIIVILCFHIFISTNDVLVNVLHVETSGKKSPRNSDVDIGRASACANDFGKCEECRSFVF